MRYILILICLTLSTSALASEKESAQEKPWTDEYQYGDNEKEKAPKDSELKK